MGNSGPSCHTKPRTASVNNPLDLVGEIKENPSVCAPSDQNHILKKYIPDNGEYEYVGKGTYCYYCHDEYPTEITCNSGCAYNTCCSKYGYRVAYKRTKYLADPVECCLNNLTVIGNKTCDPRLKTEPTACPNAIKDYCIQGNNLFTKDICKTWCAENQNECFLYKQEYCNTKAPSGEPNCKIWCMQNQGQCDNAYKEYCQTVEGQNDPECACILSDLLAYKYNPLCEDRKCIQGGYQTSSMISALGNGCQIVDCGVYFDVSSTGNVEFDDVELDQRCANEKREQELELQEEKKKKNYKIAAGVIGGTGILLSLLFFL